MHVLPVYNIETRIVFVKTMSMTLVTDNRDAVNDANQNT